MTDAWTTCLLVWHINCVLLRALLHRKSLNTMELTRNEFTSVFVMLTNLPLASRLRVAELLPQWIKEKDGV